MNIFTNKWVKYLKMKKLIIPETYVKEFDLFVKKWCVKILHKYL
jgi:hypothetical protein